jgi:hypothetical protein
MERQTRQNPRCVAAMAVRVPGRPRLSALRRCNAFELLDGWVTPLGVAYAMLWALDPDTLRYPLPHHPCPTVRRRIGRQSRRRATRHPPLPSPCRAPDRRA